MLPSYEGRFGSLGKVALLTATRQGETAYVDSWVMSCRAFSRRIEHACLRYLFADEDCHELVFDFSPTERNGPLREFLASLCGDVSKGSVRLSRGDFEQKCPALYHRMKELNHG